MRKILNLEEGSPIVSYSETILSRLKEGILLNTQTEEKFNTMVISWGHIGRIWNVDTFVVYVRENRYTRTLLDETNEFSISIPIKEKLNTEIFQICGLESGRNIDKVQKAKLTLVEGLKIKTSGIKEVPFTLECKVLYSQKQDLSKLPAEIVGKMYPQDVDGTFPRANRDAHIMYVGEIVGAYIID